MSEFSFFYLLIEARNPNDDWRQRYIWHRTKSGQRNKIKVKSLPKEDQWKYAPLEVKLKRQAKMPSTSTDISTPTSEPQITQKPNRTVTLYYSADRPNGFDKFEEGKLVMATDDSSKAIDIEKQGHKVAVAHGVPLKAFIKYWNYEEKDWKSFPKDMDKEDRFELIRWTDNDVYLVDFFKFKDVIQFQLSDPNDLEEKE